MINLLLAKMLLDLTKDEPKLKSKVRADKKFIQIAPFNHSCIRCEGYSTCLCLKK